MIVVWLKRDLRIDDHAPLAEASALCALDGVPMIALYAFEPDVWSAPDADASHLAFVRECLAELDTRLRERGGRLVYRLGDMPEVLETLHAEEPLDAVLAHEETGNSATYARDIRVARWCRRRGVAFREFRQHGVLRPNPGRDGWAERWERHMRRPRLDAPERFLDVGESRVPAASLALADELADRCRLGPDTRAALRQRGGEREAVALLTSFLMERCPDYRETMGSPVRAWDTCSRLSPHLAWGSMGVRRAYQGARRRLDQLARLGETDPRWANSIRSFLSRLSWHCHFIQKLEDEPHLESMHYAPVFDGLRPAEPDMDLLRAWRDGQTGYPLVDACMRSLRVTGWLTFRMRAMVMSFASYHLWLDWRHTGPILARWFTDYEPGIHWTQCQMQSGTTGINTIRIYNPYKQAEEHDAAGVFVRRWVPELSSLSDADLIRPEHTPLMMQQMTGCLVGRDYPAPIVHHETAYAFARDRMHAIKLMAQQSGSAARVYDRHGSRRTPLSSRTR